MKQNTKFLWMYILILFSFALILIIFAGLSHNTEDEQKRGLKEDITELSHKNTELSTTISNLETQLSTLTTEKEGLKSENEALKAIEQTEDANDALLMQAGNAKNEEDDEAFNTAISTIDSTQLTELQLHIYNDLTKNIEPVNEITE